MEGDEDGIPHTIIPIRHPYNESMFVHRKPTNFRLLVDRLNTLVGTLGVPAILKSSTDLHRYFSSQYYWK